MTIATHYAVRVVAKIATADGYRVRFTAAASYEAADFRLAQEQRAGFPAEVVTVTEEEWEAIKRGFRNGYKPTPGLH